MNPQPGKKLILGNWKMHGSRASAAPLARSVVEFMRPQAPHSQKACAVLCPPTPLLAIVAPLLVNSSVALGAQDCAVQPSGAYTGDVSAEMLKDAGCSYVIVGHSERRSLHHEASELVAEKAGAALRAGLTPVICVGETLVEREGGKAEEVVANQVSGSLPVKASPNEIVLAYEPVWAIGTGKVASEHDIAAMHKLIHDTLLHAKGWEPGSVRVVYGGSVKPQNAKGILATPGVDGALVGGASLVAEEFCSILSAVL